MPSLDTIYFHMKGSKKDEHILLVHNFLTLRKQNFAERSCVISGISILDYSCCGIQVWHTVHVHVVLPGSPQLCTKNTFDCNISLLIHTMRPGLYYSGLQLVRNENELQN